jgi:hypothetical protein
MSFYKDDTAVLLISIVNFLRIVDYRCFLDKLIHTVCFSTVCCIFHMSSSSSSRHRKPGGTHSAQVDIEIYISSLCSLYSSSRHVKPGGSHSAQVAIEIYISSLYSLYTT